MIEIFHMKDTSHIIDDLAKLAGGAAGIAGSVQQQIRNDIKARVDEVAERMDLVPREDYERLEAVVKTLEARITELEKNTK